MDNNSDDIFMCPICFGPLTETVLFPCCAKYSCLLCIANWFTSPDKQSCPFCRTLLSVTELVDAQYVDKAREHLEKLKLSTQEKGTNGALEKYLHSLEVRKQNSSMIRSLETSVDELEGNIENFKRERKYKSQFIPDIKQIERKQEYI